MSQNCKNCIKEQLKSRFLAFKRGIKDYDTYKSIFPLKLSDGELLGN